MMEETRRLPFFVYGTLLPNQPNAHLWGQFVVWQAQARFVNGRLYDMGHYPMLVATKGGMVKGMVVQVTDDAYEMIVKRLDALEGFKPTQPEQGAYRRIEQVVHLENGRSLPAWVYVGSPHYVVGYEAIEHGDWLAHMQTNVSQIEQWWHDIDSVAGLHE